MKTGTPDDIRYIQQTQALDEIAAKLGVVAYRPDYHGSTEDKNTVMFYIPEDAMHNRMVDQQPRRYSRSAAASLRKEGGTVFPDECIYRDSFWIFENSDVSGQLNMNFANLGKLDLCCADWKEKLEGHIRLALIQKMQARYIANIGGYLAPREADDTNNDMNRESIEAFKMAHGGAFLGNINFYSDTRKRVLAGEESVYKEYTGQKVFNFSCDFVVPCKDEELERMIREWNRGVPNTSVRIEKITSHIEKIGGIQFIWY